MEITNRTVLALTNDAVKAIADNTTERKRGEWVSKAIIAYVTRSQQETSVLERIEQRLVQIEALLNNGS